MNHSSEILDSKSPDKGWRVKRTLAECADMEREFAKRWIDECKPNGWLNYGFGLIQDLFMRQSNHLFDRHGGAVVVLTKRERMIAATVIQWLGSNVGFCFLREVLNSCGYEVIKTEHLEDYKRQAKKLKH